MTDDFEARWRAVAAADPMHATYPEAVPGYRRTSRPARHVHDPIECGCELSPADAPPSAGPDLADVVTRTDRDTGGMIAQFSVRDDAFPPELRAPGKPFDSEAELRQALKAEAPKLATPDAVQALRDAIARADAKPRPRWWDVLPEIGSDLWHLITWWRR